MNVTGENRPATRSTVKERLIKKRERREEKNKIRSTVSQHRGTRWASLPDVAGVLVTEAEEEECEWDKSERAKTHG